MKQMRFSYVYDLKYLWSTFIKKSFQNKRFPTSRDSDQIAPESTDIFAY